MGIPLPLVRANQIFIIVFSVLAISTQAYAWLLFPFVNGLIALVFKRNPVMLVSRNFLSRPPQAYILKDRAEQRFNQWIATLFLLLALAGDLILQSTWMPILFTAMVGAAATIALLGFCVGCWMRFQWIRVRNHYRVKHQLKHQVKHQH